MLPISGSFMRCSGRSLLATRALKGESRTAMFLGQESASPQRTSYESFCMELWCVSHRRRCQVLQSIQPIVLISVPLKQASIYNLSPRHYLKLSALGTRHLAASLSAWLECIYTWRFFHCQMSMCSSPGKNSRQNRSALQKTGIWKVLVGILLQ